MFIFGYKMMKPFSLNLHPKHMVWLMPLLLSGIMSGAISMFNMFLNTGWVDGFMLLWLHAWSLSWLMAFPLIMIMLPLVRKLLLKFVIKP